jgi:DeoR/GlpR family transcriptional regulator of sugar metabolism
MQIAGRDLKLVGHIARHRFLSTEQLVRLNGGSLQGVRRCLKALFGHGYLDRPKVTGPRAMVYGITRKGARLLREQW